MRFRAKYVRLATTTTVNLLSVAVRWKAQYLKSGEWYDADKKAIYEKLVEPGVNLNIEAVERAIGNKTWTRLMCIGCGEYVLRGVEIGEYDGNFFCETCVNEAAELLRIASDSRTA